MSSIETPASGEESDDYELTQPFHSQATTLTIYCISGQPVPESKTSVFYDAPPAPLPKKKPASRPKRKTGPGANGEKKKPRKPRQPVVRNDQGFDVRRCVDQHEDHPCCFVPKGWGSVWKDKKTRKSIEYHQKHFCTKCLLKPCLVVEKNSDMHQKIAEITEAIGDEDDEEINWRLRKYVVDSLMPKVFTKKYAKSVGIPSCIAEWIDGRFEISDPDPEDSDDEGEMTFSQRTAMSIQIHASLEADNSDSDEDDDQVWVNNALSQAENLRRNSLSG